MKPLTNRQQEVLDLLKRHLETTGMPPTRAEISRELGFKSPNAAEEHLKALARKGAIEIISGASRGIRILTDDSANEAPEGLPLIGRVLNNTSKGLIAWMRICSNRKRISCLKCMGNP